MRCFATSLVLLTAAGWTLAPAATLPLETFAWRAPLRGSFTNGALYRLKVPLDVLDGSRAFPADLRILDREGHEWPFYVWRAGALREQMRPRVEWLETRAQEPPARAVQVDLRVHPARAAAALRHDRVLVVTSGQDFVRRVEILGSDDRAAWRPLGEGHLVDEPRDARLGNRLIEYGATNVPYLRVLVYPSARNAQEVITVRSIDVLPAEAGELAEQRQPLARLAVPAEDLKVGVQTLEYDVGFQNLPLQRLRMEAADETYARPVKVFGRNIATNAWRWVADGGLHRMDGQVRSSVDLREAPYRFLKVELYHYEQSPLTVTSAVVELEPSFIIFEAQEGARPYLYFGASRFMLPRYDLPRRATEAEILAAPACEAGPRQRNPSRLARSLRQYGRWMGAAALGVFGILGALVLVNVIRRRIAE